MTRHRSRRLRRSASLAGSIRSPDLVPAYAAGFNLVEAFYLAMRFLSWHTVVETRQMYKNTASNVDRSIGELLAHARRTLGRDPGIIVMSGFHKF